MFYRHVILAACVILQVSIGAHAAPPKAQAQAVKRETPSSTIIPMTRFGYGTIKIGLKPGDISGYTVVNEPTNAESCYVAGVREVPDLALLVIDNVIRRISIGEQSPSEIKTDRGIGIGAPQSLVRQKYKQVKVQPDQYLDAPASYITWIPRGSKQGFRFEVGSDGKVKVIHAGSMPALSYVERCG